MVVGGRGLRGQPVPQHVEGELKVAHVSATALNLSTVARSVLGRPPTVTAVTRKTALLVSISHFSFRLVAMKAMGSKDGKFG